MKSDPPTMKLYGQPGWGSTIVEAQLVWYGAPFAFEKVGDLFKDREAAQKLRALNPLAQIPTLVLEDGQVMTESAAITLHLADLYGMGDLVPMPGEDERAKFLRWLVFITSNIYPTYTYADDPTRFVKDEAAAAAFKEELNAYQKRLYGMLHDACPGPFFLGQRFSAIDTYIAVLTHWRPGREWFESKAKRLAGVADRVMAMEEFGDLWARSFPPA